MTWTALQWVWRLESPLFIGMPPAGALNRCRPYVPARVLWGAATAEISRSRNGESFPDYGKFGWEVALNCRFTYLYPAGKRGDKFLVWLPKFEKMKGLLWDCLGSDKKLSDRDFRRRLLDSRPGTAIAPETNSASEGTLRETECINPWWRDSDHQTEANAVLLFGYVFLRNNGFRRQLDQIVTISIGGDTRYGLGKMRRVQCGLVDDFSIFGKQVHLDGEHPVIQSDIVLGHAPVEASQLQAQNIKGAQELLGGWDQGIPYKGELTWAPGSSLPDSVAWSIDNYGYWRYQKQE